MKTLKLSDIIRISEENNGSTINIEEILKYKRSLITYFKEYYCCDPILLVTDVFNACSYGIVVSANDFEEAAKLHIEANNAEDSEEDKEGYYETMNFNSKFLSQL